MRSDVVLVFILVLTASSLIMAKPAFAQIPAPSVPEFTLKFVDSSFDVPPTYGIDQFTGKTVITQSGYHRENTSLEVSIKNQPLAAYSDGSGHFISLFYNFTFKGHYGDIWKTYRDPHYYGYVNASRSDYTVTSFPLQSSEFSNVPAGGQVDFRVEALTGYQTTTMVPTPWGPGYTYEFTGESSGWSSTQTITIPEVSTSSPTPTQTQSPSPILTPTPSPSPSIPEFAYLTVAILVVLATTVIFVSLKRKVNTS